MPASRCLRLRTSGRPVGMGDERGDRRGEDARRPRARGRPLRTHRRLLAGAAVLLLGIGVMVVFVDPFAGTASRHGGALDNGSPTSTRPVKRTSLSSQTQVSGTLVYAGSWTVVPAVAPGQAVYTMLPSAGRIVRRGRPLFTIDGEPTLLLYGSTPVWRSFQAGMSPGIDVAELNANLRALGLDAPSGDRSPARRARRSRYCSRRTASPGPARSSSARSCSSQAPCG